VRLFGARGQIIVNDQTVPTVFQEKKRRGAATLAQSTNDGAGRRPEFRPRQEEVCYDRYSVQAGDGTESYTVFSVIRPVICRFSLWEPDRNDPVIREPCEKLFDARFPFRPET
jgi:hypothetical protein